MRHSGRVLRPPGKDFPEGLLPDLWGFGAEKELRPAEPHRRHVEPATVHPMREPRAHDPLAGLIDLIGKLFA